MISIRFTHIDQTYVGFEGDRDIISELRAKYSFYAPNYKFDKRYKAGYWDGKISIFNTKESKLYAGLLAEVKRYLDKEKIEYEDLTELAEGRPTATDDVLNFYRAINGPFVPHEPQILSFQHCIENGRNIILAPTSNGKSYIIHGLNAFYKKLNKRVLLVIDRAQLVLQLKSNFVDEYGSEQIYSTSTIYENDATSDVTITTWQSIIDNPQSWFRKFDVIIGDEVHKFKAKSLINLMAKCGHMEHRHGFTATLDNESKTDAMTLEGLFGTPFQAITLSEQIDQGLSARPNIFAVIVRYSLETRKELQAAIKKAKQEAADQGKKNFQVIGFQTESKFLEQFEARTQLIAKIVAMQQGNTLVAFKNHEHGKSIYQGIAPMCGPTNPIFFANSTVSKEKRFAIQKKIETLKQSVAVVSFGTFSTGINIPNLNNLIIGSQVKSLITVPQLIGRMIRLTSGKTTANVIDICDDLSHNGIKNNFLLHFEKRMKFYIKNGFQIKTKIIAI